MRLMLSTTLTAVMGAALQPPSLLARYLRLCPHYFLLPQHAFGGTFTEKATKPAKRAINRDLTDRNLPDVFDVVYDTYGRDGFSNRLSSLLARYTDALASSLFFVP